MYFLLLKINILLFYLMEKNNDYNDLSLKNIMRLINKKKYSKNIIVN